MFSAVAQRVRRRVAVDVDEAGRDVQAGDVDLHERRSRSTGRRSRAMCPLCDADVGADRAGRRCRRRSCRGGESSSKRRPRLAAAPRRRAATTAAISRHGKRPAALIVRAFASVAAALARRLIGLESLADQIAVQPLEFAVVGDRLAPAQPLRAATPRAARRRRSPSNTSSTARFAVALAMPARSICIRTRTLPRRRIDVSVRAIASATRASSIARSSRRRVDRLVDGVAARGPCGRGAAGPALRTARAGRASSGRRGRRTCARRDGSR